MRDRKLGLWVGGEADNETTFTHRQHRDASGGEGDQQEYELSEEGKRLLDELAASMTEGEGDSEQEGAGGAGGGGEEEGEGEGEGDSEDEGEGEGDGDEGDEGEGTDDDDSVDWSFDVPYTGVGMRIKATRTSVKWFAYVGGSVFDALDVVNAHATEQVARYVADRQDEWLQYDEATFEWIVPLDVVWRGIENMRDLARAIWLSEQIGG